MSSFIYRKNRGEVLGASSNDAVFESNRFFGVSVNPSTPDGGDLAITKIHVSGVVRNADAGEISNFSSAITEDDALQIRVDSSGSLDKNNNFGLHARAILEVIRSEINILRAEHGLSDRTRRQIKNRYQNMISRIS